MNLQIFDLSDKNQPVVFHILSNLTQDKKKKRSVPDTSRLNAILRVLVFNYIVPLPLLIASFL